MIVNNKCPNVRVFPYKKGAGIESFFMFPGVNGSVPDAVAEHASFKEQKECGLMVVVEHAKDIKFDATRENLKPDAIAKLADLDVVATVLGLSEEKASALIADIVKEPTLSLLKNKETRGSVLAEIEKQLTTISTLNVPAKK